MHFGHVGQPRPEPVNLTSPPVTTIRICVARESQTNSRNRLGAVSTASPFAMGFVTKVNLGNPYWFSRSARNSLVFSLQSLMALAKEYRGPKRVVLTEVGGNSVREDYRPSRVGRPWQL